MKYLRFGVDLVNCCKCWKHCVILILAYNWLCQERKKQRCLHLVVADAPRRKIALNSAAGLECVVRLPRLFVVVATLSTSITAGLEVEPLLVLVIWGPALDWVEFSTTSVINERNCRLFTTFSTIDWISLALPSAILFSIICGCAPISDVNASTHSPVCNVYHGHFFKYA